MVRVGRTIAIAFVGLLLVLSLLSANLAVGADRTVLDREFVTDSLEEENAYRLLVDEVRTQLETGQDVDTSGPVPPVDEVLPEVVTEQYVRNQVEPNVDNVYDYLHGDDERLYVAIDTRPVKEGVAAEARETVLEEDISEYDERLAAMAESEQGFQRERAEFEQERKERIQAETDRELSEAELDEQYDQRREEIRAELTEELESEVAQRDTSEEIKDAQVELGTVRIDGLLAADMTYDEFTADLESARESLATAVADTVESRLNEELSDTLVLTENMDQQTENSLETVRSAVSIVGILVFVLPLLSIALAGAMVLLAPSRSIGLAAVGVATALAGIVSAAAIRVINGIAVGEVQTMVETGNTPPALADLVLGLIGRFVGAFSVQSQLLVGLGVLLVVVGVALHRDLLPIDELTGAIGVGDPAPAAAESGMDSEAAAMNEAPAADVSGTASEPETTGDADGPIDGADTADRDAGE